MRSSWASRGTCLLSKLHFGEEGDGDDAPGDGDDHDDDEDVDDVKRSRPGGWDGAKSASLPTMRSSPEHCVEPNLYLHFIT